MKTLSETKERFKERFITRDQITLPAMDDFIDQIYKEIAESLPCDGCGGNNCNYMIEDFKKQLLE